MEFKKIPFEDNHLTELTPEQIEAAKAKYKAVFEITVEDKKCWLHKPDRNVLDLANSASSKKSSKFNETILRNCWLAGDKDIVEEDDYFYGASTQLDELITFKNAELKKY